MNNTALNRHVLTLFEQARVRPAEHRLALVALARWAEDNLADVEPQWLEARVSALVVAEMENPAALDSHLGGAWEIESAKTLEDAALLLLGHLADLMPGP